MLASTHRAAGKQLPLIFLYRYDTGGESFLLQIDTGGETWLHFVPEVRLKLTEGCHIDSLKEEEIQECAINGKNGGYGCLGWKRYYSCNLVA
jgi:hypothetical protein